MIYSIIYINIYILHQLETTSINCSTNSHILQSRLTTMKSHNQQHDFRRALDLGLEHLCLVLYLTLELNVLILVSENQRCGPQCQCPGMEFGLSLSCPSMSTVISLGLQQLCLYVSISSQSPEVNVSISYCS